MKQYTFTLLLFLGILTQVHATLPKRYTITTTQPDGTTLNVTIEGNGRFITYTTSDNLALIKDISGTYYYAQESDSKLFSTNVPAHEPQNRTQDEINLLSQMAVDKQTAFNLLNKLNPQPQLRPNVPITRASASTSDGLGTYGSQSGGTVNSIGAHTIPVIMVEFSDRTFQDTITAQKVTRFFNEEGYSDESGAVGSVRDYFLAQSQQIFSPTFEVVAKVTLDNTYAYYGANSTDGSIDPNSLQFITDVLSKAVNSVNFADYNDEDSVPLVVLMYAGPGEQSAFEDGCDDYLWAKFTTSKISISSFQGSTTINSFFMGNELLQNYGSSENDITSAGMDGIGVFCHEFGHALGLPDFYYTGSNSTISDTLKTMDYWSIMDYGEYYYDGYAPIGYTAYERSFMGWLQVEELTEPCYAQLFSFGNEDKGPTAYIIRNPESEKEYYLLENRQPSTWYPKRMGQGMLITHVDYSSSAWSSNIVNDTPSKQRMTYVPADNEKNGTSGYSLTALFNLYKSDLFPGTNEVTSFTDETLPASTLFEGTTGYLSMPLYHIDLSADSVISFSFIDESLTSIQSPTIEDIDSTAPITFYNLAGQRIPSLSSATPGIYIRRQGNKGTKVIVK